MKKHIVCKERQRKIGSGSAQLIKCFFIDNLKYRIRKQDQKDEGREEGEREKERGRARVNMMSLQSN